MLTRYKARLLEIHTLAVRLDLERSLLLCVYLVQALGYRLTSGEAPGLVYLDRPGKAQVAYRSADALMDAVLADARRLVGRW